MNFLDAGVIIVFMMFLARGIWVGFIRQLASIAGLILGFLAAGQYYKQFSIYLAPYITTPQLAFLITYSALFLVAFLTVVLFGLLLKKVMTITLLGWFDRFLGAIFGIGKAVVISTLIFMVVSGMLSSTNRTLRESVLRPYLAKSSEFFLTFIKDKNLHSAFMPKEPAILDILPDAVPGGQPVGGDAKKKPQ